MKFAFGIGGCTAGFSAILFVIDARIPAFYDLAVSLVIFLSPLAMRITGSIAIACHALVTSIVTMLFGVSLLGGGMLAPTVPVLVLAPITATFLIDRKSGFVWTWITASLTALLAASEMLGYEWPTHVADDYMPFIRTAVYLSMIVVAMLFVSFYEQAKRKAIAEVNAANQLMTRMIGHVEATSDALSRSASEFFGTGADGERHENGLTQQMLTTANAGRAIISEVGDGIRGMIQQYQRISAQIQKLYRQSNTISDMVQTIDNISDRLDLMALNTGIEAVNAGEAGQRFQLIAEDMRRRAERVSVETRRISETIHRVQKDTHTAAEASLAGQALTEQGVEKLTQMSRAFDDMYELIERTAEASMRITHDTEVQIAAIHELADASLQARNRAADTSDAR